MQSPPAAPISLGTGEPHRMVEYVGQMASEMADICTRAGEEALGEEMRLLAKKMDVRAIELRIAARQEDQART